jgi:hypothetical protein
MRAYARENITVEKLWAIHDTSEVFANIKTLYRYKRNFVTQIDSILTVLSKEIVTAKGNVMLPEMMPGEDTARHKIQLLFQLLDTLIEILHMKHRSGIILQEERYSFLHGYLFLKGNVVLLANRDIPINRDS